MDRFEYRGHWVPYGLLLDANKIEMIKSWPKKPVARIQPVRPTPMPVVKKGPTDWKPQNKVVNPTTNAKTFEATARPKPAAVKTAVKGRMV